MRPSVWAWGAAGGVEEEENCFSEVSECHDSPGVFHCTHLKSHSGFHFTVGKGKTCWRLVVRCCERLASSPVQ